MMLPQVISRFDDVCIHSGLDPAAVRVEVNSHFKVLCGFATGSFVEGRSGPTSDLDVRAVCCSSDQHPDVDRNFSRRDLYWCGTTRMTYVGGVAIHTVYWPEDVVESLRTKVASAIFDGKTPLPVFTPEQIELFEEARVCAPVVDSVGCTALVDSLNLPKVNRLVQHLVEMRYDQACGETQGPLLKGDSVMALVRSRVAVESAVDCWINHHGGKVAKSKWRLRELTALAGDDSPLVADYLRLMLGGVADHTDATLRSEVKARLAWCNTLLLQLQGE